MYCKQCGKELPSDASKCENCGTVVEPVEKNDEIVSKEPEKKSILKKALPSWVNGVSVLCIVLIIVAAVVLTVFTDLEHRKETVGAEVLHQNISSYGGAKISGFCLLPGGSAKVITNEDEIDIDDCVRITEFSSAVTHTKAYVSAKGWVYQFSDEEAALEYFEDLEENSLRSYKIKGKYVFNLPAEITEKEGAAFGYSEDDVDNYNNIARNFNGIYLELSVLGIILGFMESI